MIESLARTNVRQYRYFDSIESTNNEALRWAESGAPDFSLVIANEQIKGRGRFDRRWVTRPGTSLAFSLILQPTEREKQNLALFSPLCGIAVFEAVTSFLHLDAEIKWPNDVLYKRKKFCGILVEAVWNGSNLRGIVLGIGINISPDSVPADEDQNFPVTCLETAAGHPVDRYRILQHVLNATDKWRVQIGSPEFMALWAEHLAFKDEWVRIEHSEKSSIIGKVKGIDHLGRLVLADQDGTETSVETGDVHLRPETPDDPGGLHA